MLRSTELRADNWLEVVEEVFDFAASAREKFREGGLDDKRQILRGLGTNLTLMDGVLSLEPNEWLIPIAESYPELEKEYLKVRTNKKTTLSDESVEMLPIIETWRSTLL